MLSTLRNEEDVAKNGENFREWKEKLIDEVECENIDGLS